MAELNGTFIWCMMNDSTHSLSSWAHKINSLPPTPTPPLALGWGHVN